MKASSWHGALAAVFCAVGVGLGAYAGHAESAVQTQRFGLAALFAFAHGLALLILLPRQSGLAFAARWCLLLGTFLFSGGLALAGFFGTPTVTVPWGGSLLLLGWILAALDYLRHH